MSTPRRYRAALLIVVVLLTGTAVCSKDKKPPGVSKIISGTPTTVATVDLCALLTPADLKAQLGSTFGAGARTTALQCQWKTAAGDITFSITVSASDFATTKQAVTAGGAPVTDVAGVGDAAFTMASNTEVRLVVSAKSKAYLFTYTAPSVNPTTATPKVSALANQAIAKL